MTQVLEAEYTYTNDHFAAGMQVAIDSAGRIEAVGRLGRVATRRLARRALLPGFVNAHSHAFQRALRAQGEVFPAGVNDFWTWRESMYALVQRLTHDELREVCRRAFQEMLAAGITTVGEFHYLHHRDAERRDFEFDDVVLDAAKAVGIRIVLLQSFYKMGGFAAPLASGQRRFATPSVSDFWRQVDRLESKLAGDSQSLGIAPHSLRAVPPEDLRELEREARRRGYVCHVHVEEQRREIDDCRRTLGCTPLEWVVENLHVGPHLTIIHGTHARGERLQRYISAGGHVCVCPITEGNLGDGLSDAPAMLAAPNSICIGSDSNIRIDACEELRWLEFVQRLQAERRGICVDQQGRVAERLLRIGTRGGAAALGLNAGAIEPGRDADLIAIDLDHPPLAGATTETLLGSLLLGASGAAVREVCVGGRWVA